MQEMITLTVLKNGWVKGKISDFQFTALVFSEPSDHGINSGRVSKLFMTHDHKPVLNYDRRWEKEADEKKVFLSYLRVLSSLEQLPA